MVLAAIDTNWGQLAFMVLAAFVMLLQVVNNLLNSRNNKEVIKETVASHQALTQLIKEKHTEAEKLYTEKFSQLHDDLILMTASITSLVGHVDKMEDVQTGIDEVLRIRDTEGRRRIYTPNNHDAIQTKTLEILAGIVASQKAIASELKALSNKSDEQRKQCQGHLATHQVHAHLGVPHEEVT